VYARYTARVKLDVPQVANMTMFGVGSAVYSVVRIEVITCALAIVGQVTCFVDVESVHAVPQLA
jgi:hypothetical protein